MTQSCGETITNIERGSNDPIWFVFKDADGVPMDLGGSQFLLTLTFPQEALTLDTSVDTTVLYVEEDTTIDPVDADPYIADRLVWARTLEQSRLVPLGNLTRWAIERRIASSQEAWGRGRFCGVGGDPPDV